MEIEYARLVATRGEAPPLWAERFGSALPAARAYRLRPEPRRSARALAELTNVR
jgi:hypothetical protein